MAAPERPQGTTAASYFAKLAEVSGRLGKRTEGDEYGGPYDSHLGYLLLHGIRQATDAITSPSASLTRYIEPARDILFGVEDPHAQIVQELGMFAARINDLVPEHEVTPTARRRDHGAQVAEIDRFQKGFVGVIEELLNGTTETGDSTQFKVLSRITRFAFNQIPAQQRDDFFAPDDQGRLRIRDDQEITAVAQARDKFIVGRGVNMLLPRSRPVTAHRAIASLSARIAIGIIGGYRNLPNLDNEERARYQRTMQWLSYTQASFDPQLSRALALGGGVEAIGRINDTLRFIDSDIVHRLPGYIALIPNAEQFADVLMIVEGLVKLGMGQLSPLLELKSN